ASLLPLPPPPHLSPLPLHDALPICLLQRVEAALGRIRDGNFGECLACANRLCHGHKTMSRPTPSRFSGSYLPLSKESDHLSSERSEEHTSELQSPDHLVCRLLLEKK